MAIEPVIIDILAPVIATVGVASVLGWVATTWLKVKNGYPLENSWGKPLYPNGGGEAMERIRLLSQENAQLRAELGSLKDRMAVLERIATDQPSRLAAEIDALAAKQLN
ncbi:hypothetical protein [Sandarakinorhabdus rubra]|uniref:hypothetical protein n=1 Tax=Sandarakinorhabdus rubra TaxID=2672568 RepID=UPI0013DD5F19|nr:hypothetical protein [Sandarakinorhabdus rubra]